MKRFLAYAYLLRIPLFLWLALLLLVPGATNVPLFRGMFVFEGWREVFFTSFIVFLTAASMMVMVNLVLLYGERRLYGKKEEELPPAQNDLRTTIVFLVCLLPALFFVWRANSYTLEQSEFVKAPEPMSAVAVYSLTAGGFLVAGLVVVLAKILQMLFANAFPGVTNGLYLILPLRRIPWLGTRIGVLYSQPSPLENSLLQKAFHLITAPFRFVMRRTGEGYYDFPASGMRLLPGQAFGAWLAFLALVSYWISGSAHKDEYQSPSPMKEIAWLPTIFHVVIALLLVTWLLWILTFFFDRYRVPVISVIAAGVFFSLLVSKSDHVFELAPGKHVVYMTPNQVLRMPMPGETATAGHKTRRLIVVAAAGGGIQAAAWTARVLGGLAMSPTTPDFSKSVRAISGVSGGSVGALYYLTTYPAACAATVSAGEAIKSAAKDSLEGIAWGLVHPDLSRIFFPWAVSANIDRGWALEKILAKRSGTTCLRLSDMATAIPTGVPAVLFNSTAVETGAPMVFASTDFPELGLAAGIDSFRNRYGDTDIDIATAVRLSATFPYVSPAARPSNANVKALHFVDGGYYDNYGMAALIAWLRAGLTSPMTNPAQSPEAESLDEKLYDTQILIVQINSFPPAGDPAVTSKPWPFQLIAPIFALYDAREHSQQARDEFEFQLQHQAPLFRGVSTVQFQYNPRHCECQGAPPLSWHLTRREIQCIDYAWGDSNQKFAIDCVSDFLKGNWDEKRSRACEASAKPSPQPQWTSTSPAP